MLSPAELKCVISTLSQRRSYLLKALEKEGLDAAAKTTQIANVKLIDSSLKKISTFKAPKPAPASSPKVAQAATATLIKKPPRKQAVAVADAYVLIAEDNADSALLLRSVLEDMGIKKIDAVEDGRAAVRALENCSPSYDIVLCDWDMPEMNGLEVRKTVKPLAKLRDTHFMMVTANSESSRIKDAILNGVHDYIVKPIDVDILEDKIKAALAGEAPKKEHMIANKKNDTLTR